MAVIALSVPRRNAGSLLVNMLKSGLPAEVQDDDGVSERVYVDVEGIQEKILLACLGGLGVQVHDTTFFVQGKKVKDDEPDGVTGTGIPNGYDTQRRIMDVQGGTLSIADLSRKPNR